MPKNGDADESALGDALDDIRPGDGDDLFDEFDDDLDTSFDEIEEAHQEGYDEGRAETESRSFGCGCVAGIALTLIVFYMGWCTPHIR